MSLLLFLTLLSTAPDIHEVPNICVELTEILGEAVEEGYISINEAGDVITRAIVTGKHILSIS